jgi:cell division protein ZapA
MAEVTLTVGGFSYKVACRDGEEEHLLKLGALVDAKAKDARSAVGNAGETRQLLLAALLFADEASETVETKSAVAPDNDTSIETLERLADKIEAIADRLEA